MEAMDAEQVEFALRGARGHRRTIQCEGVRTPSERRPPAPKPTTRKAEGLDQTNPRENRGFATSLGDLFADKLKGDRMA